MPLAAVRPAPRKRVRKRKRRAASFSSSSSSSSDSDSEVEVQPKPPQRVQPVIVQPEESSSSSESSESSSDSESEEEPVTTTAVPPISQGSIAPIKSRPVIHRSSPSPSPPPTEIPTFINMSESASNDSHELALKEKFRKFWMASVADGFKDDLEEIRKEPNLGTSRLALLIDSLASGADVFTSNKSSDINEIEVILE